MVQIAQLLERYWLQRGLQQQQQVVAAMSAASFTANGSSSNGVSQVAVEPVKKRRSRPKKSDAAAAAAVSTSSSDYSFSSDNSSASPQQQLLPAVAAARSDQQQQHGAAAAYQISNMKLVQAAKAVLPYTLTSDQENAVSEVLEDLARPQAMLRLLQGDVGCGKTVVAALACLAAAGSGMSELLISVRPTSVAYHYGW